MRTKLSIIIVNYNGERFLKDCIESIKNTCHDISYEIIIVDNASQDNSVELLESQFIKDITLIKSKDNLGFAKGNNLGVSKSNGELILLLNNDTILKHSLKAAIEALKNENVGVVGIKMLGKDGEYRHSVGYFPSASRLLKLTRLYNFTNGFKTGNFKENIPKPVDWVEGSFLMTKTSIYHKVNGLDENYFMYVEDIDFCKKVTTHNFKVLYLPNIEYLHFGGYGASREHMLKEGFKKYINKHLKTPNKQLALLSVGFNFIIKDVKKTFTKTS
jgi:GT2 family glycosyltransferase